ncbi:DUF6503 family protein [Joostella sp. CR20]|uniref:DUF6503 family protein n=1 Tax=Joostella sp. CR20 TaxID=2804312 RepID=UPI00313C833A
MKKIITLLIVAMTLIACSSEKKKETVSINLDKYPPALIEVFKAHGGLEVWKNQKTLSFTKGNENYTVDLDTRKSFMKSPAYSLGFNGKEAWLVEKDSTAFKGNPDFYHNLYFYFYAMPFVLADDGIKYSETSPLTVDGIEYPGVKISYNDGVGASSKDNYYLYYDKNTHQMQWLAYTVTFFDNKPKAQNQTNVIRYEEWQDVNGLKLPKTLVWYAKDSLGNVVAPKEKKPVTFTNASLSTRAMDSMMFEKH